MPLCGQSAIVVQPHHKALLVLLQMGQQLVVVAFAIHHMDRARLRSQARSDGRDPVGPSAAFLLRIPEPGPPVRLDQARGIRLSDEGGQPQHAQRGAQAVRRDRQRGMQPEPVAPRAKHRQACARRFAGEHVFGGVMKHQHVPDRPAAVGGRLHMGRDHRVERDPTIPQEPVQRLCLCVTGARLREPGVRMLLERGDHAIATGVESRVAQIRTAHLLLQRYTGGHHRLRLGPTHGHLLNDDVL